MKRTILRGDLLGIEFELHWIANMLIAIFSVLLFMALLALVVLMYATTVNGQDYCDITATTYHAIPWECDSTPNVTADGTRIYSSRSQRIIAVSWDLLSDYGGPYDYGDKVRVRGAGRYSGTWTIRDKMASRWRRRIDFCIDRRQRIGKWIGVRLEACE